MLSALLLLLSSCDGSTPEESQARTIAKCQNMITTTRPMLTAHLPLTERGKEIEFNGKWERCRTMVEDKFLEGERERLPEYDESVYLPLKKGGRYYLIPKRYVATQGIAVPYVWKYSYIEYDIMTRKYYVAPPEARNGVYFGTHSINDLAYQRGIAITSNYDEVCEKSKTDPDEAGAFIWNGILFGALTRIEHKGDNQIKWQEEWQRICPIAVEIIKQFKEVELQ